jgi:hypothetical protein
VDVRGAASEVLARPRKFAAMLPAISEPSPILIACRRVQIAPIIASSFLRMQA